ncbi:DUF2339 domain-containing protein [Aestuariibius sp. 2305UL40-4]|uniref:DUF2339 domain-containing protein n=1 Tax=Aestuariibius violaceus TaxID=3234132 RepID=UPI00345F0DCB
MGFLVLVVVYGLFCLIAVPVLVFQVLGLKRRMRELEQIAAFRAGPPQSTTDNKAAPTAAPTQAPRPKTPAPSPVPEATRAPDPVTTASPPPRPPAAAKPTPAPPRPPAPAVRPTQADLFFGWLAQNWAYVLSAISLALAGIFLVQYGIETGILTPTLRVLAALVLGASLCAAGEWIRRRSGDGPDTHTAFLPSTFSGAGIVVLYAAVLAARHLYGLIGVEGTFFGLATVSAVALVFGWFYGPFLAAIGIAGGAVAPYLLGADSGDATPFIVYLTLLALTGLAIDAVKQTGWITGAALTLPPGSALVMAGMGAEPIPVQIMVTLLALAALVLPIRRLVPMHEGRPLALWLPLKTRPKVLPDWHVVAATGAVGTASLALLGLATDADAVVIAAGGLTLLTLAIAIWAVRAPAIADAVFAPVAIFLLLMLSPDIPAAPPVLLSVLLVLAVLAGFGLAWRSERSRSFRALWAALAVTLPSAAALALMLFQAPEFRLGTWPWTLHLLGLAALFTLLAERFAAADGGPRNRTAYATLGALTMIALALFTLLGLAALTVALAVLLVVASLLDRRFDMPEMTLFTLAGLATLTWRLVIDPGTVFSTYGPLFEVLVHHAAALAGPAAALAILTTHPRPRTRVYLETALWAFGGITISVLFTRWLIEVEPNAIGVTETAGIYATIWGILALAQYERLRKLGRAGWIRPTLALIYTLMALGALAGALLINPLFDDWLAEVTGVTIFNSSALSYLLPAILLAVASRRLPETAGRVAMGGAIGLAAFWTILQIRIFWQGTEGLAIRYGITQGEISTYTGAMLLLGAALFYQAVASGSALLRRAGLTLIGLTVAKVFLIDAAGLTGLVRVGSFLALGLSLAGLAWLDRWASGRRVG